MFLKNILKYSRYQRCPVVHHHIQSVESNKLAYIHQTDDIPLRYENMGQQIQRSVEKYAKRVALKSCHEQKQITFEEAYEEAAVLAIKLKTFNLDLDHNLAIWVPNTIQYYITLLASALGGFPLVCINPVLQKLDLKYALEKAKVKTLLTMDSCGQCNFSTTLQEMHNNDLRVIMKAERNIEEFLNYDDWLKEEPSSTEVAHFKNKVSEHQPESPFTVQFTSGTTGQPKAALLSHFGMVNEAIYIGRAMKLEDGPKSLCLNVPLFHAFGLCVMAAALNYGTTLCLPSPTFNAEASLSAIEREKCHVVVGTPTMFVDLIETQKRHPKNTDSLELAFMGGSACSPEVLTKTQKVLKIPKVRVGYGLSEASGAVFANDDFESPEMANLSCGKLFPHSEAKIVDDSGNTVKFGEVGELCIRGWFTMLGYFEDDFHTRKTIDFNGWLKTGDQFILEENGVARFQSRKKDIIIRGGENIFPKEIEAFLDKHPSVLETQVIGVPHQRLGEEVCAYLRLNRDAKPLTLEDIKVFCQGQLAHFKVPAHVRIVQDFPKTTSGKIQKFKLEEMFLKVRNGHLYCNTLNDDWTRLVDALNCFDSSTFYLIYGFQERLLPAVKKHLLDSGLTKEQYIFNSAFWYHIRRDEALKFDTEPPQNVTIKSLDESHAEQINSLWPHRSNRSVEYVEILVKLNESVGLFEGDKLVAWCLSTALGALGLLQVEDAYKRRGFGNLAVRCMSKYLAENGIEVTAPVVFTNVASRSMFEKLGFKIIDKAYWAIKVTNV